MEKTANNAFYLPAGDYVVLAALWGLDELQSLFRIRQEPLSEQEVYYALHHLVQRNIINENRELCDPYKEVFERIFSADRIWMLYRRNPDGGPVCCYPGDRVVITEASGTDRNALRIRMTSPAAYVDELLDIGQFPAGALDEVETPFPESALIGRLARSRAFTEEKILEPEWDEAVQSVMEEYDLRSKRVARRLIWFEYMAGDWVLEISEEGTEVSSFDKEKVRRILEKAENRPDAEKVGEE